MPNRMLPLYIKIADHLRKKIVEGKLPPDSRLPNQRELAEEFNTTLMTVRQALEVLEEESLIRTEHGVGSFVISPQVEETNFNLLGFSNEMSKRALLIETRIISLTRVEISPEIAEVLMEPVGGSVVKLERLRLLNGKPLVYQCSYLPERFEQVLKNYSPDTSLYQHLYQSSALMITMAKEILKPVALKAEQADYLKRKPQEPALLSLRVSLNQDGSPVIFDEAYLVEDSFVIETERFGRHNNFKFHVLDSRSPDPLTLLMETE
jgi:GntR family transcriptional regulator